MKHSPGRKRLDVAVAERGLAESRARAQSIIMGGGITVDGQVVTRPAALVDSDSAIALVSQPLPYVGRGGIKLRHALDHFDVPVAGVIAADIGASTGGFTDVLLQAGAARVYTIDVGYGQLAWKLRTDPRVIVMERTNIRKLESLPEPVQVAVIDVSFISLRQVLPAVSRLLTSTAHIVALVKPQFEAGRAQVGKKGVVRDARVWADVLQRVLELAPELDLTPLGLLRSPILGPAGNVEFLLHLGRHGGDALPDIAAAIANVVTARD